MDIVKSYDNAKKLEIDFAIARMGKYAEKYFDIASEDVKKMLEKRLEEEGTMLKKDLAVQKFSSLLTALEPSLKEYADVTDSNEKQRVGNLIFKNLNFEGFNKFETFYATKTRISNLFKETTSKSINPYKIIWLTTLYSANCFYDEEGNYDYSKETIASFNSVYNEISRQFMINGDYYDGKSFVSDRSKLSGATRDASALFEKCSSLLYGTSTVKIERNFKELKNLAAYNRDNRKKTIFRPDEVCEIVKNNPSLLTLSTSHIRSAYEYIISKGQAYLNSNPSDKRDDVELMRDWIKNNSTVLTINSHELAKREKYLRATLSKYYSEDNVDKLLYVTFANPTNICALNAIPRRDFYASSYYNSLDSDDNKTKCNYSAVINYLVDNLGKYGAYEYLLENRKALGVSVSKIEAVHNKLKDIDASKGTNYASQLFALGDTIMSKGNLSIDQMVDRIVSGKILKDIDVEKLSQREIAKKFYEVFAGKNASEEYTKYIDTLEVNMLFKDAVKDAAKDTTEDFLSDLTNKFNQLVAAYNLDREESFVRSIKDNKTKRNKIIKLGREANKMLSEYTEAVASTYGTSKENIPAISKAFKTNAIEIINKIDELYLENFERVKKFYKTPNELYYKFKNNTQKVMDLDKAPHIVMSKIAKKVENEIIKPVSTNLIETSPYQTNMFTAMEDDGSGYIMPINSDVSTNLRNPKTYILPVNDAERDKDTEKFLRNQKTILNKMVTETNPYSDNPIDLK